MIYKIYVLQSQATNQQCTMASVFRSLLAVTRSKPVAFVKWGCFLFYHLFIIYLLLFIFIYLYIFFIYKSAFDYWLIGLNFINLEKFSKFTKIEDVILNIAVKSDF